MLTLGEVFDAIEKNGWPKATRAYQLVVDGTVHACAIGQAGMNLDIDPELLGLRLSDIDISLGDPLPTNLYTAITNKNDKTDLEIPEIARELREQFKDYLHVEVPSGSYR